MRKKNILWICTDQQRFDTLGCYGNDFVDTPNLDRLAETGMLFEHCYSQSPVCTPSRASFLTGRYPRTTRCRQNGQSIPPEEVLVTRILDEAGYTCGLAGKLHLSACCGQKYEARIDDGYSEFHWSHHPAPDWPTNEYSHWLREQGVEYEVRSRDDCRYVQTGMPEAYHQTTWCAQKAINFIEAHAKSDNPWLFSVNIFDPHHPFDPPESYLQKYLDRLNEIPLPRYTPGELDNKPIFQQIGHERPYDNPNLYPYDKMSDYEHRLIRAAYWAMIDLIDVQVGHMLSALESTGQLENTIVVFTSDHGEMLGDHGIYLKGPYFYEEALRVPLIISGPGVSSQGERYQGLVELVDLAPTLLDALGFEAHPGMQGRSFWDVLSDNDEPEKHRTDVYCEYYDANFQDAYATMVRTEKYKLVVVHGRDMGELYDLEQDPGEINNLWQNSDYQLVKMEMLKRLCDRMAWTVDPLPLRLSCW